MGWKKSGAAFYPQTWTEVGLWALVLMGVLLGQLKRFAPVSPAIITLTYDALCFGLLLWVLARRWLEGAPLPASPMMLPLFLFATYAWLEALNPNLTSPLQGVLGWRFAISGLFLHFLGFYAFDSVAQLRRWLVWLEICAVGVALVGVSQKLFGYNAVELVWIQNLAATMTIAGTGQYRLMATMGSAVDLGFFLMIAFLTTLAFWVERPSLPRLALLGLLGWVLVFTFVRTVWLATGAGVLVLGVVWVGQWQRPLGLLFPGFLAGLGILGLVLVLAVAQFTGQTNNLALQERVGSLASPLSDPSVQERLELWQTITPLILAHPLGVGIGATGASSLRNDSSQIELPDTFDNTYLKILVELGWPGLALFLFLLASLLWQGVIALRQSHGPARTVAWICVLAYGGFLLLLFFGEYIELNPGRSFLWLLTGILFRLPRLDP